jgi:hypothetical protein
MRGRRAGGCGGSEETIRKYVQEQGIQEEYKKLHEHEQELKLLLSSMIVCWIHRSLLRGGFIRDESNCRLPQQCGRISTWQHQCTQL